MYLRRCRRSKGSKDHVYWELVESFRTERGPRQRVVAYLGDVAESSRLGVKQAATKQAGSWQSRLFDDEPQPEWVEVDANRVRWKGSGTSAAAGLVFTSRSSWVLLLFWNNCCRMVVRTFHGP